MQANFRMASPDDIDTLVRVRFDYFAAEEWEVSPEQRNIIEANLRRYYAKYLNIDFFAAFAVEEGEVASVAFLTVYNKPANLSFPTGKTGTVFNVLTYPGHRKKGYATGAMKLLLDTAKTQGLSYVELSASEAGMPLYQKLGFKQAPVSALFTEMRLPLL